MKHNKKRNTAFLYECLIKELTKAIVREDKKRQTFTKNILREFFHKKSIIPYLIANLSMNPSLDVYLRKQRKTSMVLTEGKSLTLKQN